MKREEARKQAEELVNRMTMEERASQLRFDAPAIERLGIPEYNWWNEALHGLARGGTATSFPQAIGMAAMFDDELLERLGDVAATEARAKYNALSEKGDRDIYKGLTIWSPNINIFRDPRWGRGHETYGEDPYLTGRLGRAYVRGLQGKGETLKTAACAKHFCAHSGPEGVRHGFNAEVSPKDLSETYLPAFKELVDEGVESVMGAYNRINGEPCCGTEMIRKTIREEWGFQGHVVSDCWAVRDFHEAHKVTSEPAESVTMALTAGCDLNCGCTYQHIMDAYNRGMLPGEYITESAIRVFTTRFLLGIMGNGSEYDSIPYSEVEKTEHLQLAHKASLESCVLLKNDGILPLDPAACGTVGVIGPNANSRVALVGNYHGTSSRYITVLEGIQDYLEAYGNRVLYSEGCALDGDRIENLARPNDRLAEAVVTAEQSDTVFLVLGLDETLEGEQGDTGNSSNSGDKADLLLPECQRLLLDAVLSVGKPTVVILMAGSSIDLTEAEQHANGILTVWYPGARGGKAVAEILFGEVSPSGKLPVTFYKNEALEEMPSFTDYSMRNRTYRYYTGKPLYPFGYGLTYGDCRIESFEIDKEKLSADVTVRNYGSRATGDVIEVFCKDNASEFAPVNPCLCGFQRIYLESGETGTFRLELSPKTCTVVNDRGERTEGSGDYTFTVNLGR